MPSTHELPDSQTLYRALESRDARLDGAVFYGITSTGIYCRPVCPARTPRFQNCRFFPSAAAAQASGFRPCLRCRPETAPGNAAWKGTSTTVARALQLIEEGGLDGAHATVEALAGRLGIGERQLRRLFLQQLGVSPISVAQTRRLLFAKQLLHDTRLPMAAVAEASGFGSERRFHESFQATFQRPPSAIRRAATTDVTAGDVTLRIRYRAPYDWNNLLHAMATRNTASTESICDGRYTRVLREGKHTGHVEVTHDPTRNSLLAAVRWPVLRNLPVILSRVRRRFDTDADIARIQQDLSSDPMLRPLVDRLPGQRVPGPWDTPASHATSLDDWQPHAGLLRIVSRLDPTVNTMDALQQRSQAWRPWRAYAELLLERSATGETNDSQADETSLACGRTYPRSERSRPRRRPLA